MGFRLVGHSYQEISPNDQGWRWSQELDLYLGVDSSGSQPWLRYFHSNGEKVLTPTEVAQQEMHNSRLARQRVELERKNAEITAQKAKRLGDRLRELGIDPESL